MPLPADPRGEAERIEALRRQRWTGKQIAQKTGVSPATVSRVLRRLGLSRIKEGTAVSDMIEEAAVELLAARLRTPLQIDRHLTLAFEEAYRLCAKAVPVEIAEGVRSRQIDDLEPTLTRHGYDVRTLADRFNTKPVEFKAFFAGTLHPDRTHELTEIMKAAGIPV